MANNDIYIKKDQVLKILKTLHNNYPYGDIHNILTIAMNNIEKLSILDLVECNDCKHYDVYTCHITGDSMHYTDWCCFGERKEKGEADGKRNDI